EEISPAWHRWSRFVARRPLVLAVLSGVLMLALAAPFLSLRLGSSDQGNDPATSTTRKAYDLLAQGFGPGFNGPFLVVAETSGADDLGTLVTLQKALAATPDVALGSPPQPSPNGKAP